MVEQLKASSRRSFSQPRAVTPQPGTITTKTRKKSATAAATKQRRTQQERSAAARAKLLTAAIELVSEKGFALTTMAEIAARAGMTRGAIQHHFAGRPELVTAILHEVESQIIASFESVSIRAGRSVAQRIDQLIVALGQVAKSEAYLAVADIWISTRADESLCEAVAESRSRSLASYRQLWQRSFGDELPASVLSECRRIVVNAMRGIVLSNMISAGDDYMDKVLANLRKIIKQYVQLALK